MRLGTFLDGLRHHRMGADLDEVIVAVRDNGIHGFHKTDGGRHGIGPVACVLVSRTRSLTMHGGVDGAFGRLQGKRPNRSFHLVCVRGNVAAVKRDIQIQEAAEDALLLQRVL